MAHTMAEDNGHEKLGTRVSADTTRLFATNIEPGKEPLKGPMNTFCSAAAYPPGDFRLVVRINFDTLYSLFPGFP
jgi:hypothetical protein